MNIFYIIDIYTYSIASIVSNQQVSRISNDFLVYQYRMKQFLSIEKSLETTDDVLAGNRNKMASLENILDEVFVRRFLIEENISYEVYEDLLVVIKDRYPNLRGCSVRSVKRFFSNRVGIRYVSDSIYDFSFKVSNGANIPHLLGQIVP